MPQYTYGGNPSAVLTTATGTVVPDFPLIVRAAGTGAVITALFEEDGTTPIAQLRSNPAASDAPGAIRTFKVEGYGAIEYEFNGPSGQPVRWYEVGREVPTAALEGLNSKLGLTGGTITGDLDVTGTVDVGTLLVGGQPITVGADWSQAGIIIPEAVTGAALQDALDTARDAGGGWIILRPGVYDVSALPLRIYRNTRLTLADGATIRRAGTGTMLLNGDAAQDLGGYTGHGNIIVEGGTWDARATTYPTSAMCMSIGHAENVVIRDTLIKDVCGYHGIEINAVRHGVIRNVRGLGYLDPGGRDFSEFIQPDLAKGSAYFGGFGPYDDTPCVDLLIEGCTVGPSGTAGTTAWPRAVGSHSASPDRAHRGIRIRDLYAEGCSQFAVGAYTWEACVISGVQLRDCGGGVRVRTLDSSKSSHRTPAGGSSPTIAGSQPLAGIVIDDVTMTGGGTYGAAVELVGEDTGYVQDVAVGRITVRSVGQQAVRLERVEDYVAAGIVAHTTGGTAVSTLGTRRGHLTDLAVNGATGAGVTVDSRSTPASTATNVTVSQFQITGTTANGVHVWDGADITVADGDVHDLTGIGVQVSTNTVRPVIRDVRTRNTTLAGINLTSTVTGAVRRGNTADAGGAATVATAANTTAETVVGSWTIPAGDAAVGTGYRFALHGTASTTGTPTLTLRVRLGGATGAVIAAYTAVTTGSGISSRGWRIEGALHCVTTGASGTWAGGAALSHHLTGTTGVAQHELTDAPVTRDTTVDQALVVTAQWSAAAAANTAAGTAGSLQRVA
ncbi:MAG TPA: hypothetical protein VFP69_15725 [Streptomyces sp.]|nr:hypothetical protein [Streptomyces sp.]